MAAAWWPSAPPQQRQHAIAGRMLVLPDGTWWLFGAWARWYRLHPSDGQWYLCPPPYAPGVRAAARPAQGQGRVPALPPHVVPAGPDFAYDPPPALPFVAHGFAADLTSRVRATVESAAALAAPDYPHRWSPFTAETPSTVVAAWGVMLWSAPAPAFDARLDAQMLDLWSPYRSKPLPAVDGPRWLTPPTLESLVGLYAERLRAGNVDAAVVVLRTMWAIASILRDDVRFQMRADALLAILGATLENPTVDYGALPYGDQALVQQWLTRCPPGLVPALRNESSPGDAFRHAFYTLGEVIAPLAGDPSDPAHIEPRLVAAALLAADLGVVRKDVANSIVPWLDPEIRYTVQAVSEQKGHPLRRLWPSDMRLPEPLRSGTGSGSAAETLLAAMYAADLAWCRLGGMPARPRGFPVPTAVIAAIVGRSRARATVVTQAPTPQPSPAPAFNPHSPPFGVSQPGIPPGRPPQPPAPAQPDRPFVQPPAQSPVEEEEPQESFVPPYTQLGYQKPGFQAPQPPPPNPQIVRQPPVPPPNPQAAPQPPAPSPSPQVFQQAPAPPSNPQAAPRPPAPQASPQPAFDPLATRIEDGAPPEPPPPVRPAPAGPPGTRVLGPDALDGEPAAGDAGPAAPAPAGGPGTRVMSETMIGDFGFLEDAPSPERPVHEIPPPEDRGHRPTLERFGITFVCGEHDAGALLDAVRAQAEAWNAPLDPELEATRVDGAPSSIRPGVPGVLLVGAPHSGQRRLARMIALTLAEAGMGDGAIRAHDADDVRDAPAERMAAILAQPGPVILFERLDVAISGAQDPAALVGAVRRGRRDPVNTAPVIATCEPQAYKRLLKEHPKLVQSFRVHRLPDLSGLDNRMTLFHVLADERRVTIGASALEAARADLERLRGPGDLVNARLVEAYLDQASRRNMERAGASHDRLVLTPDDLAGVAESIEPALRPPGDIDGYLARLDRLMGLEDVKEAVRELADEAALAADRARHGVPSAVARHLIFTGPPGTGKTTVAGLLGGVHAALGLLESGHVVACRPVHLAGRDQADTERRVAGMVDQALGGVLLIQEAHLLDRSPAVVRELMRHLSERGVRFMVVCSSPKAEMEGFLAGNPAFRAEFGRIVEFTGMADRELVRLFQNYAERDLYMLDEELRVELLTRFERLRDDPAFAYARTVRALFEQTVARQAARLSGADVNAATVARLTVRDLPETALEQMLGDFRPGG